VAPPGFPAASIPGRNGDLFINRDATPEDERQVIQAYRASASWTDWNIGRMLDALDRLGLAEKTIVTFMGDHGYHLGEKGKRSKHGSIYEVGARVPLSVRLPKAAGTVECLHEELDFLQQPSVEASGLRNPRDQNNRSVPSGFRRRPASAATSGSRRTPREIRQPTRAEHPGNRRGPS
jgi:arylsulfatase A-like enzyme